MDRAKRNAAYESWRLGKIFDEMGSAIVHHILKYTRFDNSINATDSVVLRSALDIDVYERKHDNELILVTADQRLITAAKAEGLHVIKS